MNEISQIYEISEQKIVYLEELLNQWQSYTQQMIDINAMVPEKAEDMVRIIEATISYIRDNHKHLPRLLNDLKSSLDVVSPIFPQLQGLALTYQTPALPAPHHRTKRTCHHRRVEQQSHPRLHHCDHHLPPPILFHFLLRDEPSRHCRHGQDGALFLGCLR